MIFIDLQVFLNQMLVMLTQKLDQRFPSLSDFLGKSCVGRREIVNRGYLEVLAISPPNPAKSLQANCIPKTSELASSSFPPRYLADCRPGMKTRGDLLDRLTKSCAISIKLINVNDLRYVVLCSLIPDLLRLSFDPRYAVEDTDRPV